MIEGGLRGPCLKAYAALGSSVDAALIQAAGWTRSAQSGDGGAGLKSLVFGNMVCSRADDTVDVTSSGWNKVSNLPLTEALVVEVEGAGALLREPPPQGEGHSLIRSSRRV